MGRGKVHAIAGDVEEHAEQQCWGLCIVPLGVCSVTFVLGLKGWV